MAFAITDDLKETLLELAAKYRWKEVFLDAETDEVLDATPVDNSSLYLLEDVSSSGGRGSLSPSPVIKTGVLPGSVTKRGRRRGNSRARMSLDTYLNQEELLDSPPTVDASEQPSTPENTLTAMFRELTVTPHAAPAFRISAIGSLVSDDEDGKGSDAGDGHQGGVSDDENEQQAERRPTGKRVSIVAPTDVRRSNAKDDDGDDDDDDEGECEWTEDWLLNTPAPKPVRRSRESSDQFVLPKPLTPRQRTPMRAWQVDDGDDDNDDEQSGGGFVVDDNEEDESFEDSQSASSDVEHDEDDEDEEDDEEEDVDEGDIRVIEKENRPARTPNRAGATTPCTFEQFKRKRAALARKWFETFNRRVFSNLLPADTGVEWTKQLRSTAGRCYPRRNGNERVAHIELSVKVLDTEERMKSTLLHEMCHAAAWVIDGTCRPPHGSVFYKWGAIATKHYPDLPVTRCHNFVIHKPYKYRCTVCGRHFGRHTKNSIKVEVHRCRCGGKLEFVGMFKPDGTPHKPRVANGFSLFVKENFAAVKAANPGLSQAELMRKVAAAYKARNAVGPEANALAAIVLEEM